MPSAGCDVSIPFPNITVTHATGSDNIGSLTSQANFVVSGGSLAMSGTSTITNTLTLSGGTLTGAGNLTVNNLSWAGGTLSGGGIATVAAGGNLTINGSGTLQLDRSLVTSAGTFSSGTLMGSGSITATGAFTQSSGTLGGALDLNAQGGFTWSGGTMDGSGTTRVTGTAQLTINGAGTMTLNRFLTSAVNSVFSGGTLTGSGSLTATGAFTQSGGALGGALDLTAQGAFNWSGGTMDGAGTTSVAASGRLNYTASAGTLNRRLTVSGTANFQNGSLGLGTSANLHLAGGGTIQGTTISSAANASLRLSGAGTITDAQFHLDAATAAHVDGGWTVAGQTTVDGNLAIDQTNLNVSGHILGQLSLNISNGSAFNLQAGGQFEARDGRVSGSGMFHILANGTLKTGGSYTFDTGVNVANDGTILVQANTSLTAAHLLSIGSLQLSANGIGRFSDIDSRGQITGSLQAKLLLQGGSISGGVLFPDQGQLYLNGTHFTGTSQLTTMPGVFVKLNISFAPGVTATVFDAGSTVDLQGAVQVAGGRVDFLGDASAGSFDNAGGEVHIGAQGSLTMGGDYTQESGMTILEGGMLTAATVQLQGGTLMGAGTITGDVTNSAEIDVGTSVMVGVLNITGNFTQTAAGILNLKIGAYDDGSVVFDQLNISGTATLDGTLNVTSLDNFFARDGDAFTVLTFGTGSGGFATVNLPDLGPDFSFAYNLGDGGLTLQTQAN